MSALQSGCYQLTWEKSADLPSPMYHASAVLHKKNIYVMAGDAPQRETYYHVFFYNININEWSRLPPPGHSLGRLQIINDRLSVIGGVDNATYEITNKVSTFDNSNRWTDLYPNMLEARCKPGVVTHEDHVIVLGGGLGGSDDIEVLNWSQPFHWMRCSAKLPEIMWDISLTVTNNQLYIVGYYLPDGSVTSTAYQVPVDSIISSIGQPPTSNPSIKWNKLPNAPHYDTALLPHSYQSYPPVIISGHDIHHIPTSDIAILNIKKKTWHRIASLSTARFNVAVVLDGRSSIFVIGGCTGGEDVAGAQAHSITSVDKGTVTLRHTRAVATIPTQDAKCTVH